MLVFSRQQSIISVLFILGVTISIPLITAAILLNVELGPFSLVLISLIVPILLIPCIILLFRQIKQLLIHYHYIKGKSEREKLQQESVRQRLSIYLATSLFGVSWVRKQAQNMEKQI